MKIYSYFETVPELTVFDEVKLSILWRERWALAGFEPRILCEWDARKHPAFAATAARVAALPTINPPGYERACYLRWLALAMAGGGLMSDLDVMPYDNPGPELLRVAVRATTDPKDRLDMFQSRAPALIYAEREGCEKLAGYFGQPDLGNRPQEGRPHYSDQYVIEDLCARGAPWIVLHDFVKGYGDEGWDKAKAVHYSNGSMTPAKKQPRWKHIPTLR